MGSEKYSETYAERPAPVEAEPVPVLKLARNYTRGRSGPVLAIVIHTAECGETDSAAENVAAYFAGPNAPKASAHYCIDNDSVVASVPEADTAWHAGPVNGWTIGIELAGRAGQGEAGWADVYSMAVLDRAARAVAGICRRHDIPIERPRVEDIPNKAPGIFGHHDVTLAYGHKGGHYDPGPSFPWQTFLEMVRDL